MSEFVSELELLSPTAVGDYYDELSKQGMVSATLDETMQQAIVEAAYTTISSPIGEQQACGCVTMHEPFTSTVSVQDRARLAVSRFAEQYGYLMDILSPDEYLQFVQTSGYIPALTAVGSLTAALEERGRTLRESREALSGPKKTEASADAHAAAA